MSSASSDGAPDLVPLSFDWDGEALPRLPHSHEERAGGRWSARASARSSTAFIWRGVQNVVALRDASRFLRLTSDPGIRDPPRYAAWQHRDARNGYEVVFLCTDGERYGLEGDTAAVEGDEAWAVHYVITLDPDWSTRGARVSGSASSGSAS